MIQHNATKHRRIEISLLPPYNFRLPLLPTAHITFYTTFCKYDWPGVSTGTLALLCVPKTFYFFYFTACRYVVLLGVLKTSQYYHLNWGHPVVYVKIYIGKNRRTQENYLLFVTWKCLMGSRKALPCTFHFTNSSSLPDEDPIAGSKLVALCNKQ
jgi:hypothetical protein